jgi:hypothetical protein
MSGRVLMHDPLFAWLDQLPGFAKLRAAARFAVIAQLALSVLAALGVAAWLHRRRASPREAGVTAGLLAALVFVEGLGVPLDLQPFSPYVAPGDRQACFWLARHPGGAVLDLPFEGWSDARYDIYYQYRTLLHGHPIVNGIGRWRPPLLGMLGDPDSPLYNASRARETTTLLRASRGPLRRASPEVVRRRRARRCDAFEFQRTSWGRREPSSVSPPSSISVRRATRRLRLHLKCRASCSLSRFSAATPPRWSTATRARGGSPEARRTGRSGSRLAWLRRSR